MSYSVGLDLGLKSATPNHPVAITALFKDKYDYEVRPVRYINIHNDIISKYLDDVRAIDC